MEGRVISTILEARGPFGAKGSYRVKLGFTGSSATEYWMTEKQLHHLRQNFDLTPRGYTCKQAAVYGVFDGDRFVWSGVQTSFKSDIPFLQEKFGVEIRSYIDEKAGVEHLDMSEPVEVVKDLLDQ